MKICLRELFSILVPREPYHVPPESGAAGEFVFLSDRVGKMLAMNKNKRV